MITYFIIGYVVTFIIAIYLLAKYSGEIHVSQLILTTLCPPASIIATIAVYSPSVFDWDGVLWRKKDE